MRPGRLAPTDRVWRWPAGLLWGSHSAHEGSQRRSRHGRPMLMKRPLRPSHHAHRPALGTARTDEAAGPTAETAPPPAAASARELGRRLAEARLARGEDA